VKILQWKMVIIHMCVVFVGTKVYLLCNCLIFFTRMLYANVQIVILGSMKHYLIVFKNTIKIIFENIKNRNRDR